MIPFVLMQFITVIRDTIFFLIFPLLISAFLLSSYGYFDAKWKLFLIVIFVVFLTLFIWKISLNITMSIFQVYKKINLEICYEDGNEVEV